jgi:hypothetical protein
MADLAGRAWPGRDDLSYALLFRNSDAAAA